MNNIGSFIGEFEFDSREDFIDAEQKFIELGRDFCINEGWVRETFEAVGVENNILEKANIKTLKEIKQEFLEHAKFYSELKGTTFEDFKEMGIPGELVSQAGIERTTPSAHFDGRPT